MDTETFLVKRQLLRAHMETSRVMPLEKPGVLGWSSLWSSLPFLPIAGFLAARGIDKAKHPLMRGVAMESLKRMTGRWFKQWGIEQLTNPAALKRLFSLV